MDVDPGFDCAGRVVAQSADLSACRRDHRLAPAWACNPDARGRAWMLVASRNRQSESEPVVLRLSDFCRDPRLSPLSLAASCADAAGRRSRSRAVGAVSDHQDELPPQIPARYYRTNRLSAAQGAIAECARPRGMAFGAARRAFLGEARSAICRQRRPFHGPCCRRHVVGVSAVMAAAVAYLDDGDHPHPQHRRTRRRSRQHRSAAQYAHHPRQYPRAPVHRTVLRELSP